MSAVRLALANLPLPGSPEESVSLAVRAVAEAGTRGGAFDLAAYERLSKRWEFWGWVAILTPVAGVALMVVKPAL